MWVKLEIIKGPQVGREITFHYPRGYVIGRAHDADLRLPEDDSYVSRRHVYLEICPPACWLRNLGSTNSPHVNGEEVIETRELNNGDIIELGYTQLRIALEKQISLRKYVCPSCRKTLEILADEPIPDLCAECAEALRISAQRARGHEQEVRCSICETDITAIANSDGRAEELAGVVTYVCEDCMAPQLARAVPSVFKIGNFQVISKLGEGGMGEVYQVYHPMTARILALKCIKNLQEEILVKRFQREMNILREIHHDNVVRFIDSGKTEAGRPFIVTEWVPDGCLEDLLASKGGKLAASALIPLADALLLGLQDIHEHEIIHRDIKPQNILLRNSRSTNGDSKIIPKLADFGVAFSFANAGGTRLTPPNTGLGTLIFTPPEQILDAHTVRESADIYSLGVTLYYALTGKYSFDFPAPSDLIALQQQFGQHGDLEQLLRFLVLHRHIKHPFLVILENNPIPLRSRDQTIPQTLAAVIDRAVCKDAGQRYPSAISFRHALLESV